MKIAIADKPDHFKAASDRSMYVVSRVSVEGGSGDRIRRHHQSSR